MRRGNRRGLLDADDVGGLAIPGRVGDDRIAKLRLLDLERRRPRQRGRDLDEPRDHVVRHPRNQELDQLSLRDRFAVPEDDHDLHLLIAGRPLGVRRGHRHRGDLGYRRVGENLCLDLERRDVLPTAADRVFGRSTEIELAVLVAAIAVTGVEPPVSPRLGGGLRHVLVAGVDHPRQRMADDKLARGPGRDRQIMLVDEQHLELLGIAQVTASPLVGGV